MTASDLQERIPDMEKVYWFDQLPSTSDFGKQIAADTDQVPALIYADQQTQGRGRSGKSWISDQGSLTFSFLIDRPSGVKVPRFSLTWGLATAAALNALTQSKGLFQVKWPNDVMSQGRKVAGILIESVAQRHQLFVVGIGINVTGESRQLVEASQENFHPISVAEASGKSIAKLDILAAVWRRYRNLEFEEDRSWGESFRAVDYLAGKSLTLLQGSKRWRGSYRGLSDDGGLLLDVGQQIREFQSGSVVEVTGDSDLS